VAVYVSAVALGISTQLVAAASEHLCHLYVLTIATGCDVNVTAEVSVVPDAALPVGAPVPETAGV
jgi:hypothetical protein